MTRERRQREIESLRQRFGQVEHGPNLDWVMLKEFPVPPGWNRHLSEVLVIIPPGYPTTPPDNFYVPNGLRLADGRLPGNYSENQSILGGSWAQFSFHVQGWNPLPDCRDGDSLLTFMIGVERRFQELT